MKIPGPPGLAATHRRRQHRYVLLQCNHGGAGHRLAGHTGVLPRSLDEDAERLAGAGDLAHLAHRFAIGFAASHREGAKEAEKLRQARRAHDLGLGQEVDAARTAAAEGGRIDHRKVVEGKNEPTFQGHVLEPVRTHAPEDMGERAYRRLAYRQATWRVAEQVLLLLRHVHLPLGSFSVTSASILSTTCSTLKSVVSMCTASGAGCI